MNNKTIKCFQKDLLAWYHKHKRSLPWRNINNPYYIWVSEIILQQTTVEQGFDYYLRFIDAFPDVHVLANASEQDVLKIWQGLGYYSRARNMHFTAKIIAEKYEGKFPEEYEKLIKLKGIGPYTAAAVLSFAYNKPYPVIDGNVMRVTARIFAIDEPVNTTKGFKLLEEKVRLIYDKNAPADFNQAIMEFGALQCKVRNPDCENCFANLYCAAQTFELQNILPVKVRKLNIRQRFFNYFVPVFYKNNQPYTYLKKRGENDIWQGLYDFMLFETISEKSFKNLSKTKVYKDFLKQNNLKEADIHIVNVTDIFSHKLTHQTINARFTTAFVPFFEAGEAYILVKINEMDTYPLPKLLSNFLNKYNIASHK